MRVYQGAIIPATQTSSRVFLDEHPYLTRQLFAYIGNKRALLPFLREQFTRVLENSFSRSSSPGSAAGLRFYDPFAGTGSVSRLARLMGMDVHSNDWEYYSSLYNSFYLSETLDSVQELFGRPLDRVLADINSRALRVMEHGLPQDVEPYISRHYAPPVTAEADFRQNRLFYTAENARFIDYVRNHIETEISDDRQRRFLISLLIYQSGTHANTSGVFKAYHKGFGGLGADALKRIMQPMSLTMPVLPAARELPETQSITVSRKDATLPSGSSYDLVYLDPPYNGHQYGSNYFMLNSIARWDKPEVDCRRAADGRFREKAGIRKDWVSTRSDFCYSDSASKQFLKLLDTLDAPNILLSYNTEGIIPFDELVELMSSQGRVEILTRDYTTFRGGKQSDQRKIRNMEFILSLDRRRKTRITDIQNIRSIQEIRRLERLSEASFSPMKVMTMNHGTRTIGRFSRAAVEIPSVGLLEMPHFFEFAPSARKILCKKARELETGEVSRLADELEGAIISGHIERAAVELAILADLYASQNTEGSASHIRSLLWSMKKFAFRKYENAFTEFYELVERHIQDGRIPDFTGDLHQLFLRVSPRLRGHQNADEELEMAG